MTEKRGDLVSGFYIKRDKAQLTIFILLAIVLVVGIILFFLLKEGGVMTEEIPTTFKPIESYYLDCVKEYIKIGISLLEENGGYIYFSKFEPGNDYSPTSNQLDFFGTGIPFWYYASASDLIKEQVPTKQELEKQLKKYLDENLKCDFSLFQQQGYAVNLSKAKIDVAIEENNVRVTLEADLKSRYGNESIRIKKHETEVKSKLGKFYELALKIYNTEKEKAFLEDYAIDVLHLYAPVNDVELTCSPKVWVYSQVVNELKVALENNMLMIKTKGDYYEIKNPLYKYFITDIESDEAVRFLYSGTWPTKIELEPREGEVMLAEPVGMQEGLGILGFCYVPYHFVYDIVYPVLIQIYDNNEVFQFPIVVIIEANQKRNALQSSALRIPESDVCKYRNADVLVSTFNTALEPVEAEIGFQCLGDSCDIGKTLVNGTRDATLTGKFPQCVNAFITARAEGYEEKKVLSSTNTESVVGIVLDKLYTIPLNVKFGGQDTQEKIIIHFRSEDTQATILWPEFKNITLTEGNYNITAYAYKNSSIKVQGIAFHKCVDVPKPGLLGFLGQKKEQCFDMNIPGQELSSVIVGGGKNSWYISESELQNATLMEILVPSLPTPRTIEDVQNNYNVLEGKRVYLEIGTKK